MQDFTGTKIKPLIMIFNLENYKRILSQFVPLFHHPMQKLRKRVEARLQRFIHEN